MKFYIARLGFRVQSLYFILYYAKWSPFYHDTNRSKNSFRGQLSHANELLNLLDSLIGNLEGHFELPEGGHLIPSSFTSIEQVMGITHSVPYTNKHNFLCFTSKHAQSPNSFR